MVFIKCCRPPAPALFGTADFEIFARETVHSSSLCAAAGGPRVVHLNYNVFVQTLTLCRYTSASSAARINGGGGGGGVIVCVRIRARSF